MLFLAGINSDTGRPRTSTILIVAWKAGVGGCFKKISADPGLGETVNSGELTEPFPPMAVTVEKVNPDKVPVPPTVVTETTPEAPLPITAVIVVAFTTVKDVAGVPPKLTAITPIKLVPVIVIMVPVPPVTGVKELIVGCG